MFLNLFLFYQVVRPLDLKSVNKYLCTCTSVKLSQNSFSVLHQELIIDISLRRPYPPVNAWLCLCV